MIDPKLLELLKPIFDTLQDMSNSRGHFMLVLIDDIKALKEYVNESQSRQEET